MKNIFVFYRKQSRPSAKALHLELKKQAVGATIIRGNYKSKFLRDRVFDYIINVGNSEPIAYNGSPFIINPPNTVKVSANKRLARIRFKAKRLSAPTFWTEVAAIPKKEFPVVGRTSYHMKAKGFWYCRTPQEARAAKMRGGYPLYKVYQKH